MSTDAETEPKKQAEPNWGKTEKSCILAIRGARDPAQLDRMAADIMSGEVFDDGVLMEELIENKRLPFETARRIARMQRRVNDFGYELCSREDATPEALDEWADDWDPLTIHAISRHPNTSVATLTKIVQNCDPRMIKAALANPKCPAHLCDPFATCKDADYREIAARKTENPALVEALALDESLLVRRQAMLNALASAQVVNTVSRTEDDLDALTLIVGKITDTTSLDRVAAKLQGRQHDGLAKGLFNNPHSSDEAKAVAVTVLI